MTPPTTTDEFLTLLEQSKLLRVEQYESYCDILDDNPNSREGIARKLVREGLITSFQARQLLHGRYKGFFLTDKYKILDVIGEGGMGRVLLCEHLMLQRLVAVKILNFHGEPPPPGTAERFLREARAAAALDHPNITRVFDADYSSSGPFMVMEYVDGTNLHQVVADHGALPAHRAANYIYQAALALGQANKMGLIHRDIKPGNLLLDREGNVKLLDLGLARYHDDGKNESLTKRFDARNVLGTADFISPEQTQNSSQVDIRADIYSLGCSLYFLLTRKLPFEEGSITQKLLWHQSRDLPSVKEAGVLIPAELDAILYKMTRKFPEERYQTPQELAQALLPWSAPIDPPPDSEMPKVKAASYKLGLCPPSVTIRPSGPETMSGNSATVSTPRSGNRPFKPGSNPQKIPSPSPMKATEEFTGNPTKDFSSSEWDPDSIEATALDIPINVGLMSEDQITSGQHTPPPKLRPPATQAHEPHRISTRWLLLAVLFTAVLCIGGAALAYAFFLNKGSGNTQPNPTTTTPTTDNSPASGTNPSNAIVVEKPIGGSSSINPLMQVWIQKYAESQNVQFKYQSVGSERGINNLIERNYLIGTSDAPLTDKHLNTARGIPNTISSELVSIPLCVGAVAIAYKLPNLPEGSPALKLDAVLLSHIFAGKITAWNDTSILKLNPKLAPYLEKTTLPIHVVRRVEGSGASFLLVDYLLSTDADWKALNPQPSTQPNWPKWPNDPKHLSEVSGSSKVTETINRTAGAIGYVELSHASQAKLAVAELKNQSGEFVKPTPKALSATSKALKMIPDDLRHIDLVDLPDGSDIYPICGITSAILYANSDKKAEQQQAIKFLKWCVTEGQTFSNENHYSPLPQELKTRALAQLDRLEKIK